MDDDNYVILPGLRRLLSSYHHSQDVYLGRPSLDHPIQAADRVTGDGKVGLMEVLLRSYQFTCGCDVISCPPAFSGVCEVLVRHRWSRVLHQPRSGSEDEPVGQVRVQGGSDDGSDQ